MELAPITPPLADSIAGDEAYLFAHQHRRHHFEAFDGVFALFTGTQKLIGQWFCSDWLARGE